MGRSRGTTDVELGVGSVRSRGANALMATPARDPRPLERGVGTALGILEHLSSHLDAHANAVTHGRLLHQRRL